MLLILSLVAPRYVDEAVLGGGARWFVRSSIPFAAILLPVALFLSVLSPDATQPTRSSTWRTSGRSCWWPGF